MSSGATKAWPDQEQRPVSLGGVVGLRIEDGAESLRGEDDQSWGGNVYERSAVLRPAQWRRGLWNTTFLLGRAACAAVHHMLV